MLLSTGAIVPELRVGREWELEGKLVNMWCIVMCMSCYIMLCHVVHVLHVQVIMCCVCINKRCCTCTFLSGSDRA